MKKTLLILALLSLTQFKGQNCQYSKNEQDKFEGYFIKMTLPQSIFNAHSSTSTENISFSLSKLSKNGNELRTLHVSHTTRFTELFTSDINTTISIMLSNDSIVTLKNLSKNMEFSKLDFISVGNTSVSEHSLGTSFVLNERQIQLLSNNLMTSIRINYKDKRTTIDLEDKVKKKMGGVSFDGEKGYNPKLYFKDFLKCID